MTIGKPARFRWTALALSIAAACSATAQAATPAVAHAPGSAADAPVGPSRHGAEPESLFLEVVLNGVNLRLLGYFQHEARPSPRSVPPVAYRRPPSCWK